MADGLRFSVGIPTKNQADFIRQTLDSLLSQTRLPDEIVVSDHQSTDETPAILAEYVAKYRHLIRVVQPPAGCGISEQWNFTLSALTGDWLTLFSSDDIAYPNFCEVLLRGATRREDAILVRAAWENIDDRGAVLSREYLLSVKPVTFPPATLLEQKNGPKASFAAFAVKREALESSGGYPRGMESFGDWPMFMQLAPSGSFIYEGEIISGYRIGHDGDKFRRRIRLWLRDELRMFQEVMPLAAERARMQDRTWITKASRENLYRYLAAASEEFAPDERDALLPEFTAWAQSLGEAELVSRFAAGETVRQRVAPRDVARRVLRPIAQRLAHSFVRR
jgi:glycosyltransferase involved in cell wall biosynthesis